MEVAPLGDVQLPPGQCMGDIICVVFHPTLPSAYVALRNKVVEYDLLTGGEIGVVSLRMVPQRIMFLASKNALVVCMIDGSVDVVDVSDGHILAEHHASKAHDARPFAGCELFAPPGAGFSFLYYARSRSNVAQAINLFAQNKKPATFSGHKHFINCLACHHALPLVACAAVDGTVRLFLMQSAGLYNVLESEKEEGGAKIYCAVAFHRGGSRVVAGGGKKEKQKKQKIQFYRDLRLLLASEHSLITYYDVSIPGAPNKLRSFYSPGSTFRAAHFHTFHQDLVFTLDHKGRYLPLWADPSRDALPGLAAPAVKKKGVAAAFQPNTKAFALLSEYENIRPLQLRVSAVAGRRQTLADPGTNTLKGVNCVMHPGGPYFIFYGGDMADAGGRVLTVYHLDSLNPLVSGLGYGLSSGRAAALPLHTAVPTPVQYWYSPAPPHNAVDGEVYSVSLRGNNKIVLTTHALVAPAEGASDAEVCSFTPKTPKGVPMSHCSPLYVVKSKGGGGGAPPALIVSVLHNGREGHGLPYYTTVPLPADGTAPKPSALCDGICYGTLKGCPVVVSDYGKKVTVASAEDAALPPQSVLHPHGMRVASLFVLSGDALILQCNEASGQSRVRWFASWDDVVAQIGGGAEGASAAPPPSGCIDLDAEEGVTEVAECLGGGLVAISTTRRVLIARNDAALFVFCAHAAPRVHSLQWVGSALAFVTRGNVFSLTPNGAADRITSLPYHATIASILYDRFVVCTLDSGVTSVWSKHANHFGTLCRGALSRPDAKQVLRRIAPTYDCRHVTPALLQLLSRRGFAALASQLARESKLPQTQNVFIEAVVGRDAATTSGWLTQCRLHIVAGDLASAVGAFKEGVLAMRRECGAAEGARPLQRATQGVLATPVLFLEVAAALLQLTQRLKARPARPLAEEKLAALAEEVLGQVDSPAALLGYLRRKGDAEALRLAGALFGEKQNALLCQLASVAADTCAGQPARPPPLDGGDGAAGTQWTIGAELRCVTQVAIGGAARDLPPLPPKSIRSYLWSAGGRKVGGEDAGEGHDGAGGEDGEAAEGDADSDDSGDDDGTLQVFGAEAVGVADDGGDAENEDEIAKQQEELRRKYLNSMAGMGEDDDANADDDDEDGFGRKKFKKFEIKKEAIVTQPALDKIAISMPFPGMPAAGDAGGDAKGGDDAPPPAYLGTSAPECLKKGIEKFERGKYEDASRRFYACLVYLKADSTQVTKKTPLIQAVQYILCCNVLKEMKGTDEDDAKTLAVLSYLVAKQPLQRKHQLQCVKKAVKANLMADNYGLIRDVVMQVEDPEEHFADDLKTCDEMQDANEMPIAEALLTDGGPFFCWKTYEAFPPDTPLLKCTYCPATFAFSAQDSGVQCSYCKYGIME